MKKLLVVLACIVGVQVLLASQNRKVLLIGIDGTRSDAFQQANTPNIDGLLSTSLYTYNSWHTAITWSGPSWATILTGVYWNKHGVVDNGFANRKFNQYPPLPTLAKQINPNLNSSIVAEWAPLLDSIDNADWTHKVKIPDMKTWITADSTIAELQNPDIDLLFTYFDQVDMTGHFTTFSAANPLYINAIQSVDSAIGFILDTLYARPNYANENWLILLVTDHGGNGYMHGGNSVEERQMWWIAAGSVVAHQEINEQDPNTYNCHTNNVFDTTCVNYELMRKSPVHPDVTVTLLHHLIYDSGINPETKPEWKLDGKSWLLSPNAIAETEGNKSIAVYPNPSNGSFIVNGLNNSAERKLPVEIFTMEGKKIFSTVPLSSSLSINANNFFSGIYLLKAEGGCRKIIVE